MVASKRDPSEGDGPLWFTYPTIEDTSVVPNHAYVVESVERGSNGHDFVITLQNPWGAAGGSSGGIDREAVLYLSDDEFYENFSVVYSATGPDRR